MEVVSRDLRALLASRGVELDALDDKHKEVLELAQGLEGCWIAGGAPLALYRGKFDEIRDWDLFFDGPDNRAEAQRELISLGFEETNRSDWSITFSKDDLIVQTIIIRDYNSADEIFAGFDISVCCFAIEDNHMTYTREAQQDVENMVMNFINTESPVVCMKRIAKYGAKGFKLTTSFAMNFIGKVQQMQTIRANEGNAILGAEPASVDDFEDDIDHRRFVPFDTIAADNTVRAEEREGS